MTQTATRNLAPTERILHTLLRHRRVSPHEPTVPDPLGQVAPIATSVTAQVEQGQPILLVLPAFPCKSPNPAKVAGPLPDEGERLALHRLHTLCEQIAAGYSPGARLVICSDGHVFSDVIGVSDEVVDEYGARLQQLAADERLGSLGFFALADAWPEGSHADRRERLTAAYAEPLPSLRAAARSDADTARVLRGMTRFLKEDAVDLTGSRSQQQREAKQRAYQLLARSRAWGALLADRLPDAVRLSIHPYPLGADKLGVALVPPSDDDPWLTPWHSVVVYDAAGRARLTPHAQVPGDARPVLRDGQLWCYSQPAAHARTRPVR